MPANDRPVVFVHGLWVHPSSWAAWEERFAAAGYKPTSPGWPGDATTVEEARANPQGVANVGVDDVVTHLGAIIDALPEKPILVGHSFGGLIVQKLLGQGKAAAAVAIDAAQIKGVLPLPLSALRVTAPVFRNPANRKRAVALTAKQFRYGFGNAVSEAESNELYERWAIPSPGKPLFEAATANFLPNPATKVDTANATRGPLLLTLGGRDHTVPPAITRATYKLYGKSPAVTDLIEFPDRGHSLTMDGGWLEVADKALEWLGRQGL